VWHNIVQNNAGGILISDDTAAAYYNLVEGNTVKNNPFGSGITLASHRPAIFTGASTPFGVTHNTITGNLSSANGLSVVGAGAGVGIFDPFPGTVNSGNLVINNTLTNNGSPGVAIHGYAQGESLTDNQIVGNAISGNGQDTGDAATSGPTGINVFSVSDATGTGIIGNNISGESLNVVVNTQANVEVHLNDLLGKGVGVENSSIGTSDAVENWWGCFGGPGAKGCSTVSTPSNGTVPSIPFATKPF
jgi:nitrous oxidase accessory protein NosD